MTKSLYERMGGKDTLDEAVDLFYRKVLLDDRISSFFIGVDMNAQIAKQRGFLAMVFGGPHQYTGRNLRVVHRRLLEKGLTDSHFDAVIELLTESLDEVNVGEQEIKEAVAIAESYRDDVLNR